MAGETTHPNYFILLGLDPDAPWDAARFKAALQTKRSEWSRQSAGVGAKAIAAQKNREMIPDIERVMGNQALREAEAAAARKERATAARDRSTIFDQQLALAEAKGYLEKGEFDKLVADFKDVLSEREIRRRLKVEVRVPTGPDPKTAHKLDRSVIKTVEQLLAQLGIPDLYQLLALKPNTPAEVLCRAADQLYRDMTIRQPKDAEVTAKSELAGHAKDIFQSSDKRTEYNDSLLQQAMDALLKPLDESMSRPTDKTLHAGQVQIFLRDAAEKGWQNDPALAKLMEHARQRKWFVEVPTLTLTVQQRCGNCGVINPQQNQFCRKCNKPLLIQCPNCDQRVPSDEAGCNRCGFPVGNAFWVDEVLIECDGLLHREEIKTADERLRTVERAWTPKKADERVKKIRSYREKIQSLAQQQQKHLEQLRQMIDQHRFYSAQQYLAKLPARLAHEVAPYQKIISENLARTRELVKQAQSPASNNDRKAELCLQALKICADAADARALLSTIPPAPPGNVQAEVHGTVVSLSWDASLSRGVSYKIVCKGGSRPSSVTDGKLLGTITGHAYDDAQPENGIPLFYAVFSAYAEITSEQSTVLARPVLLARNVSRVTALVDNGLVDLRWQLPEHVHDVVVVRKSGSPPTSSRDGTPLSLTDKSRLVDRTVQNDQRYYYGIYCLYQDYDQRLVSSSGVIKEATPETPPAIITELHIQSMHGPRGYDVRLNWTVPVKGQVMVLKTTRPSELKTYSSISKDELKRYGELLQGQANALTDRLNGTGIVYYTPVVIFQNNAYIGVMHRYVCVEDVTDLEFENLGNALRLQWTWPGNCQEALVCFGYAPWPTPNQATTNATRITRTEYEYHGHYDIHGETNTDYYIVVAAIIKHGNEEIVANGARLQARLASKVVLTYEIKQPRGLFGPKQYMLHLSVRSPGQLPTLLLINKQGHLPIMKTEGDVFFRLQGPIPLDDNMVIPLPDKPRPPKTFAKLYLEDDKYYNEVIIHHPSEDKLRLS